MCAYTYMYAHIYSGIKRATSPHGTPLTSRRSRAAEPPQAPVTGPSARPGQVGAAAAAGVSGPCPAVRGCPRCTHPEDEGVDDEEGFQTRYHGFGLHSPRCHNTEIPAAGWAREEEEEEGGEGKGRRAGGGGAEGGELSAGLAPPRRPPRPGSPRRLPPPAAPRRQGALPAGRRRGERELRGAGAAGGATRRRDLFSLKFHLQGGDRRAPGSAP